MQRPDIVPGVPFYLYPFGAPGGKVINPVAFATPVPATAQGDLGRNALRGFAAAQWDLTMRRQFHFTERLSLQARGDFFNILNHPNFGSPINYLSSPQFGQATQMLNNYLGSGGQCGALDPTGTQTSILNQETHRVESSGYRLSGVAPNSNNTTLHTAEIAVASHRAAEIE